MLLYTETSLYKIKCANNVEHITRRPLFANASAVEISRSRIGSLAMSVTTYSGVESVPLKIQFSYLNSWEYTTESEFAKCLHTEAR